MTTKTNREDTETEPDPHLPVQKLEGVLQYAYINVAQQYRPAQLQELLYDAKLEGRDGMVGSSVRLTLANLWN